MYLAQNRTIAFVYKWTHIPSLKWYIGSRTAKGCHPNDGYITSSKTVRRFVEESPGDWCREILVMGNPLEIRILESYILHLFDARNDPRSFNMHNGDGKFTTAGKPAWNKGIGKKYLPKDTTPKVVWNKGLTKYTHTGLTKLADYQLQLAKEGKHNFNKFKGIPKSEEHKQKQRKPKHAGHGAKVSAARKGKIFLPRVTRIHDRREMDIGNFNKWVKRQTLVMRDDSVFRDQQVQ